MLVVTKVKTVRTRRLRSLELIVSDWSELRRRQQDGLTSRTTAANQRSSTKNDNLIKRERDDINKYMTYKQFNY
jgi:hypothetical protein